MGHRYVLMKVFSTQTDADSIHSGIPNWQRSAKDLVKDGRLNSKTDVHVVKTPEKLIEVTTKRFCDKDRDMYPTFELYENDRLIRQSKRYTEASRFLKGE